MAAEDERDRAGPEYAGERGETEKVRCDGKKRGIEAGRGEREREATSRTENSRATE